MLDQLQSWLDANTKIGAAMVVDHAGAVAKAQSGVRVIGRGEPIRAGDRFHIGSITKSFTAALVGHYIDQSALDLADKMEALAPDWSRAMRPGWRDVRLAELLSHQSGLPANINYLKHKSRRAVVHAALSSKTPKERGKFCYSNLGYIIIGALLEERFGASWEELIFRDLLGPLGIKSAGFGPPPGDAPLGHFAPLPFVRPRARANDGSIQADNPESLGPAGRLHMRVSDLARFGRAVLDGYYGRASFISQNSAKRMMTPHAPIETGLHYGLGWIIAELPEMPKIFWHNGSNRLWLAELVLVPECDLVLAYAANDARGIGKREQAILELVKKLTGVA